MPNSTTISNNFLDAVLRLKCPAKHKELLIAIVRIVESINPTERTVSIATIANYLGQDKSNVAKRLKNLIECNVIKENRPPGYTVARQLIVNLHYSEWKAAKLSALNSRKIQPAPSPSENNKGALKKNISK
ncbi:MAG TPA: replication protein [Ignavibacteriales bacterium]|nr:replication protein [Ignavibacteriales bacterium]